MTKPNDIPPSAFAVIREPKGGPDAVLAAPMSYEETLIRAGNILSVMGYTARLIVYRAEAIGTPRDFLEKEYYPVTVIMGETTDASACGTALPAMLPVKTEASEMARVAVTRIKG